MPRVDRRALIADTVIRTLAREGSRGLTHRAIDTAAGLPAGSTSYYLPSRAALLTAAVERLAELDAADVAALEEGDPVAALTALVQAALVGEGRDRTLARYELSLEAVRRPELRRALSAGTSRLEAIVAERLTAASAPAAAAARARDLLAFVDGVLFSEVTGATAPPRSPGDVADAVRRALQTSA